MNQTVKHTRRKKVRHAKEVNDLKYHKLSMSNSSSFFGKETDWYVWEAWEEASSSNFNGPVMEWWAADKSSVEWYLRSDYFFVFKKKIKFFYFFICFKLIFIWCLIILNIKKIKKIFWYISKRKALLPHFQTPL